MPYSRPGYMAYATREATDPDFNHGDPVAIDNLTGIAVKQKATSWQQGFVGLRAIGDNEDFAIITKGIVQVPQVRNESGTARDYDISALGKGAAVYIDAATGNLAAAGTRVFGRVVELPADGRGVPTGYVRIDLDKKDSV